MLSVIRKIGEDELSVSADVIRRSFQTVAEQFGLTKENAPTHTSFLEDGQLLDSYRRGTEMFGLFEEGVQIGFVALEQRAGGVFSLKKLAVLPRCRHKGGGRMLMDYAKEIVKQKGGREISIGIVYENTWLLEWYKAYGFEETGTETFPELPFTVGHMRLCV